MWFSKLFLVLGLADYGYQAGVCGDKMTICAFQRTRVFQGETYQSLGLQPAYSYSFAKGSYVSFGVLGAYETHQDSKLFNRAYWSAQPSVSAFILKGESNYGVTLYPLKFFTTEGKRETNKVIRGTQVIPEISVWVAYPLK